MAQESKRPHKIFVGKLSPEVEENALREHFSKAGEVLNVKIVNKNNNSSAHAFVTYASEDSAQKAINELNMFGENQIDVQKSHRLSRKRNVRKGPNRRVRNGRRFNKKPVNKNVRVNNDEKELSPTTLYVSNIPFSFDDEKLRELFEGFKIKTARTVTRNGKSRGYGFVEFETEEDAKAAVEAKKDLKIEDREVSIRNAYKIEEAAPKTNSTNTLYVSNLSYKLSDEAFSELFKGYNLEKAYVARTKKGRSKGFGFVVLAGDNTAATQEKVIAEKNQSKVDDREIFVRPAYNTPEKVEPESQPESVVEVKQIALYVSNIPFSVNSENLADLFKDAKGFQSANVVAAKKNGKSRGYGFVIFDTEENRDNALEAKKDSKLEDRPLSISVAVGKKSNKVNNRGNNQRRRGGNRRFGNRRGGRRVHRGDDDQE